MSAHRWERANGGIWMGADHPVTSGGIDRVRAWLEVLPGSLLDRLRARRVCVWVVRRVVDFHPQYFAGYEPRGWTENGHGRGHDAVWQMEGLYMPTAWPEGRRWRPAVLVAEEWRPRNLGRWVPNDRPYALYHELGHAAGQHGDRTQPDYSPAFRSAFLAERRALLARGRPGGDLQYFAGHWSAGRSEVWAEAFAALYCTLPGTAAGYDALFRATFPQSLAQVAAFARAFA